MKKRTKKLLSISVLPPGFGMFFATLGILLAGVQGVLHEYRERIPEVPVRLALEQY